MGDDDTTHRARKCIHLLLSVTASLVPPFYTRTSSSERRSATLAHVLSDRRSPNHIGPLVILTDLENWTSTMTNLTFAFSDLVFSRCSRQRELVGRTESQIKEHGRRDGRVLSSRHYSSYHLGTKITDSSRRCPFSATLG